MPIAFCFRLFAVVCCIVVAVASVVVVVYSIKFHLNANEKLPEERKKAQRGESCCASFFSPSLQLYNTRKIVSDCLPTLFVRMPPVCICVCVVFICPCGALFTCSCRRGAVATPRPLPPTHTSPSTSFAPVFCCFPVF